jgi:CRISPR-associated protein Cmr4
MNTCLLGLLAETSIHPGAGQSSGIVDLPVAREAATDYPVIPGSSLKGALLGLARQRGSDGRERLGEPARNRIFGQSDNAGGLLVSDARLLLLPVRSLSTAYKWITCPHLLERYIRDQHRADKYPVTLNLMTIEHGKYLGANEDANEDMIFLEERQFEHSHQFPGGLIDMLKPLILHKDTCERLTRQLVLLNNDDFAWFARYGLAIQARNVLDPEKKTSNNLWYEENIPTDALFYALIAERIEDAIGPVKSLFKDRPYLQVGGNETVGMGWFAVAFPETNGAAT